MVPIYLSKYDLYVTCAKGDARADSKVEMHWCIHVIHAMTPHGCDRTFFIDRFDPETGLMLAQPGEILFMLGEPDPHSNYMEMLECIDRRTFKALPALLGHEDYFRHARRQYDRYRGRQAQQDRAGLAIGDAGMW